MNRRKYPNSKKLNTVVGAPDGRARLSGQFATIVSCVSVFIAALAFVLNYQAQAIAVRQACIQRIDNQEAEATKKTGAFFGALAVLLSKTINPNVAAASYYGAGEEAIRAGRDLTAYVSGEYLHSIVRVIWGIQDVMEISAHLKAEEAERNAVRQFNSLNYYFSAFKASLDIQREACGSKESLTRSFVENF
ncbi:hypothetical protein [Pseudomonas sp. GW101-3H06]|uniref:hypothetical protein n=1 Tax=Pseudomonas sp. GW101-3H06 TaxID=2751347 RepID=UPI001A910292|nr:hypothetical protein [Pseudomonas sp. GW101-3H06]